MLCGPNLSDLIQTIYPNIQNADDFPDSYFLERAILSPRNVEVDEINSLVYSHFPGEGCVYSSADSVQANEEGIHYPVEYLNSINISGFPLSQLEVKRGVPLMLLRNLDPGLGLCNGTRLQLINMTNRVLHVRIITGPCVGKLDFIPRIKLISSNDLPFELHRRQFPVRLAFAMTTNKSQGQSLGTVGLDLHTPVFGHGQFYVGVTRGTNWSRVKVLLNEGEKTANIVYCFGTRKTIGVWKVHVITKEF